MIKFEKVQLHNLTRFYDVSEALILGLSEDKTSMALS